MSCVDCESQRRRRHVMKSVGMDNRSRSLQGPGGNASEVTKDDNDHPQHQPFPRTQSSPAGTGPTTSSSTSNSQQQRLEPIDDDDAANQESIEVGRTGNIEYVQSQPQDEKNNSPLKGWKLREQWKKKSNDAGGDTSTTPDFTQRPLIGRGGDISVGSGTSQPIAPFERDKLPPTLPKTIPAATGTVVIGAGDGGFNINDSISTLGTADVAAPPKSTWRRWQQKKKEQTQSQQKEDIPPSKTSLNNYLEQQFMLHRQQQQEHYDQELQNYLENQQEVINSSPQHQAGGEGKLPPPPPMSNYERVGYHNDFVPGGGDNSTITSIPEDAVSFGESDLAGEDSLVKEPSIISQEPTTLATLIRPEPYNCPAGMEVKSDVHDSAFHPNQFQSMKEYQNFMRLREERMRQKANDEQVLPVLRRPKRVNYREPAHVNIFCYGKQGTAVFVSAIIILIVVLVVVKPKLNNDDDNNNGNNDASVPTASPQQPTTPSPTSILNNEDNLEWYLMGNLQGSERNGRFGHSVVMNHDATIIASGSPWSFDGRGDVQILRAGKDSDNSEVVWQADDGNVNDSSATSPYILEGENDGDQFGRTIALNDEGNIIAVTSLGHDNFRGLVQVYQQQASNDNNVNGDNVWIPLGQPLVDDNGSDNDCFGKSIALNSLGNILAISSSRFAVNETVDFYSDNYPVDGQIRIYELGDTMEWKQIGQTIQGQTGSLEECGAQIDLSDDGNVVAFSCPRYENNRGRIAIYEYSSVLDVWEATTTSASATLLSGNVYPDTNTEDEQQEEAEADYFGGFGLSMSGDGLNVCASAVTGYYRCFRRGNNGGRSQQGWYQLGREISSLLPSGRVMACSLSLTNNGPNGLLLVSGIYLFFDWRISTGFSTIHWYHEPENGGNNVNDGDANSKGVSDWLYIAKSGSDDDFLFIGQNIGDRYGVSTAVSQNGLVVAVGADSSVTGGNVKIFGARKKE